MERQRVVGVRGAAGSGSGYVVAEQLVVTSAHVVGQVRASVEVFRLADAHPYRATVVWSGTPGGRNDAALMVVDDEMWQAPRGRAPRWGRTVTMRPGLGCAVWGFPNFAQRQGQAWETAQPSGTLNPGDRYVSDRYVMALAPGQQPISHGHGGSPWGGMSGAALFCGHLLSGIVVADPTSHDHARIEAIPAYVLRQDAGFRAVLAEHGDRDMTLAPIEWDDLQSIQRSGATRSPGALLLASHAVVPFHGRDDLMDQLMAWAREDGFGARLVYGQGGQGKTRLAHWLGDVLGGRGYELLWLDHKAGDAALEVLADAAVPLLIVVDYAETRARQLITLFRQCAKHRMNTPVKLLMLARTAGPWLDELSARHTFIADMLEDGDVVVELSPLERGADSRGKAYRQAVTAFARELSTMFDGRDTQWADAATRLRPPPDSQKLGVALTLQMTALADLLDAVQSSVNVPKREDVPIEERILRHERRYWLDSAAVFIGTKLSTECLIDALAAAVLIEVHSQHEADDLLRRIPRLTDVINDWLASVRTWIAALYPPHVTGRPWGALQPDPLAEYFVAQHLQQNPNLALKLLNGATPSQLADLLTVYSRAAAHPAHPQAADDLYMLCVAHADKLAEPALAVIPQLEAPQPLLDAVNSIINHPRTGLGRLLQLAATLPRHSQVLADLAGLVDQRIVDHRRQLAEADPLNLPDLASSLNKLSVRLGDLGRPEDGLAAIAESVELYRALASTQPDAFRPDLAWSLNNLSNSFSALGRREEALVAITEAVKIRRQLATAQPDEFLPHLASSLNNLSNHMNDVGRREDALVAIVESVAAYRVLAKTRPNAFRLALASSLHNLASCLGALGRPEQALVAITEAVAIGRALATARPDAFRPELAMSLTNLASALADLGRSEDALVAATEAVEIRRGLATARPAAFRPALASSLDSLSNRLADMGRRREALAAITEAVGINRALATARPDAFRPDLASSLSNLASVLADLGQREEALATAIEAVGIRRELATVRPHMFRPALASSLDSLSSSLADMGRRQEALAAASEAVGIRRELATARPHMFRPALASSLDSLSNSLFDLGRWEEALAAALEELGLWRQLANARQDAFRADLARCLNNMVGSLLRLGRREEALAAATEAVDIRRELARARPDAFRPALAMSLNNLASVLADLGRSEDALVAASEAVVIWRRLAEAEPDAFRPVLATSLNNLAAGLGELGRRVEALATIAEAVGIRQQLAKVRPAVHKGDLEVSLQVQTWIEGLQG